MGILIGVLEQGFIYGIMALGVYITYKILDFPDLTTDGSFPAGAAVTAVLLTGGMNPYISILISFAVGMIIGALTGIIHVKFKVRDLLSGIIMMTALYSINLRIAGKANVPLFNQETVFENAFVNGLFPASMAKYQTVIIAFVLAIISKLAKDIGLVKIVGLAIANGLIAMSGSIMCQQQRFFDVSMGTGTVVIGLANVIIGTNVFKNISFVKATTAVIIGSVVYKGCVALAISHGLSATDMKFITAFLFLIILIITMDRKKKVNTNA